MPVTHDTPTKVDFGTAARAKFNNGSGSQQAILLRDASNNVLATIALSATPFGAPDANGQITAAGLPSSGTVTTPGGVGTTATCTNGLVRDKDGNARCFFGVGTSGNDCNFDAVLWTHGGTATLSSFAWAPN